MTFLADVTPVILTFNEAPNIGRVLAPLAWASEVIVVDSGSTDETRAICDTFANVRFVVRPFDSHAAQWNFAVHDTGVKTRWVLALDADYVLRPEGVAEMRELPLDPADNGYWLSFDYAVDGQVLRSGVYPPVQALFRRDRQHYVQDGHTHRAVVEGPVGRLVVRAIHDDRKSLDRWLSSQIAYARLEAAKARPPGVKGWLRTQTPFSPLIVALHILIAKGGAFEGPAGWFYASQRTLAEALIACARLDRRLRGNS